MWSEREREELAVWADRLQSQGEGLGELVATSLAAAELAGRVANDDPQLASLRTRVLELETEVRDPMVADVFGGYPELEPTWEHGVIVALRVVDHPLGRRLGREALDSLRRLLRLPVTRFLRHLRVDARGLDWRPIHGDVPALLCEPEVVARPWSVVLGNPPRHQRRRRPLGQLPQVASGRHPELLARLADPARELRSLHVDTVRIELPWQRGDKGTRVRAAATLADGRHTETATMTRLARALWDPSLRVRLKILDTLPLLGVEAAPFVAELLLVDRGELEWLTRVREVLGSLARNPEVVTAVAANFTADQSRCASWLAASPLAAARVALPRMKTMLTRPRPIEGWARREIETALRKMDHEDQRREQARALDARNPASGPLLKRLRRWLRS